MPDLPLNGPSGIASRVAFVSITRLRIRALRFLPAFAIDTWRSQRQVERAPGFLGGSLLADRRWTFWTMTAWQDQAAMRAYMTSGPHRLAMPRLMTWCDEASVVHWDQPDAVLPDAVLPDWAEADRRMRNDGRPSKVHHPAPHHADMRFAAPRLTGAVPIRVRAPRAGD